ncbi:MAG: type II toxin-antitoxin system VapC family toxin [Limisphaerales bacterium]
MKLRLYLETTIPSYLVARPSRDLRLAADQQTTREWWDQRRMEYDLFISQTVLVEVRRGDPAFAADRLTVLRGLLVLGELPLASQIAKRLLAEGIIPPGAADDAAHLGLAAAHRMEFLLTWNCRHINNPALERRIERVCSACGVDCPVICTPAELMEE